jgi:hypothetical protein
VNKGGRRSRLVLFRVIGCLPCTGVVPSLKAGVG